MTSKKGCYKFWRTLRAAKKNSKVQKNLEWGDIRLKENYTNYCPLTYVCDKLTDHLYDENQWRKAANKLGIDIKYAKEIINAADDMKNKNKRLRAKLLKTLGLKEEKEILS